MPEDESNAGRTLALLVVVGVALLLFLAVATVIGAAVIGAFVLDLGPEVSTGSGSGSDAGFAYTHSGDEVVVEYEKGDQPVDSARIELFVNDEYRGTWADLESTHGADRTIRLGDVQRGDEIEIRDRNDGESTVLDGHVV